MKYTVMILLLVCLGAVSAANTDSQLQVNLLKYEPVPAKPGDTIEAWIQIENTGRETANNVKLFVDKSYPISPVSTEDGEVNVGTLATNSEYVTSINLAVDRNAPQGLFNLHVRATDGSANFQNFDLPIRVDASSTSLALVNVETNPKELLPGSTGVLTISIENLEQTLLRDLTISLDLTNVPLAPYQDTNRQKIASLDGGKSATFSFGLIALPDAESNVYKIPVNLTFTTNEGITISQTGLISVIIHADSELTTIVDEMKIHKGDQEGTVLLRLVNKGLSEVKFTEVTLQPGQGYELIGSSPVVYVGNIDSDDFETVEYNIKPLADKFSLNTHVTYRDSLNKEYSQDAQLPVSLLPKAKGSSKVWVLLVLIVVIVGGYLLYKRAHKKR